MISATEQTSKLLNRLDDVTGDNGQWQARCPAHDDNRASLSVGTGVDGRVLLRCHAGCATADVVGAINLGLSDLMPPPYESNGYQKNDSATAKPKSRIAEIYDYCNVAGGLVFQAVRREPKDFRQRRPNGKGGWIPNVNGCPVIPYRLPQLLQNATATVYIVEGEKDVHSLESIGLVATCNAGGALKWKSQHAQHLVGRTAVVVPDNDKTGRDHADKVAKSLLGKATSVKVVELPGLPEKGDVTDWINDCHGDAAMPEMIAESLLAIVDATPEWEPLSPEAPRAVKEDSGPIDRDSAEFGRGSGAMTDIGNGERFVENHGDRVRYSFDWKKWFWFDGTRWAIDASGEVMRLAKDTATGIYIEASRTGDRKEAKKLAEWSHASQSRTRQSAMLDIQVLVRPAVGRLFVGKFFQERR